MDYDVTRRVLEALEREGVRYVVIGGVALNLHGLPRATEDLDIFVEPERANVEALKRALRSIYDDPCIDEITADDLLGDYPAVQYVPPSGDFHIDILTRLGERFDYASLASQRADLDGLAVTIVTPGTLFRMKRDTVRAKDRADAERVARRFNLKDED